MEDLEWDWRSAGEFRARHLVGGLTKLARSIFGG